MSSNTPYLDWQLPSAWKIKPELDASAIATLIKRLEKPKGIVDVVLDTDTYNEIDDQFALAYLIKKEKKLNLKAVYAAPFYNYKVSSPEEGMEKSYEEILRVLSFMKRDDLKSVVYRGSATYLPSETTPVISDAAKHLVDLASNYSTERPLYVIAIGTITNVASALIMKPEIKEKIVVIWLGGHAYDWKNNYEYNLHQDVAGARVLFDCGVPVVHLPVMGVVTTFITCGPELEYWLRGKNELCDYLLDSTTTYAVEMGGLPTWTRTICDVTAVAWLLDETFMFDRLEASPIPGYDHYYSFDKTRHPVRYVYYIDRDALILDMFETLAR